MAANTAYKLISHCASPSRQRSRRQVSRLNKSFISMRLLSGRVGVDKISKQIKILSPTKHMRFDVRPSVLNVRHNFPSRKQVFLIRKLFPLFAGEECGTWVKWSSLAAVNMKNILGTASPSTQGAGPRPRTSTTDQAHRVPRSCLGGQFCQTKVAKCHFTNATEGFNKP